jgi:SPP1 gp7 family putative phage head morphogenesis protein
VPEGKAEAITRAFSGMMRVLHREKGAMLRIGILREPGVQAFIEAHTDALDASMAAAPLSPVMRERLSQSNYVFSGIKTFHELNEAFPSLVDANGERKPFERFLNDVRKVDETYNRNYLRAEYNFVSASSQMAARWEQFAADGDDYNLQYRTAADDLVRPEHAALHGVTLPPSDPFWQVYYPPNGWNCRCTVVQVRKDKYPVTDHDEAITRGEQALRGDKKGMFRFNSGLQGKSVPDYNPYTISRCRDCDIASKLASGVFDSDLCQACQLVRQCMEGKTRASEQQRIERNRKEYDRLTRDKRYKDVQFNPQSGALMATHVGHNSAPSESADTNGWALEVKLVTQLYNCGHSVILCDEKKKDRKGNILAALDMDLDGVRMDIKSIMKNKDFYGAAISHKNEQLMKFNARADTHSPADTVCLYFDDPTMFSPEKITRGYEYMKGKAKSIAVKHILCALNTAKGLELKHYDF